MTSFVDIIFLAVAVVFVVTRLYNVFGTHGNEKNVRVIIKSIDKDTSNNIGTIILNESIINLIIFITDKTSASSQMLSILIPSQLL